MVHTDPVRMLRTSLTNQAVNLVEAAGHNVDGLRRRAATVAGAYRRLGSAGVAIALAGRLPRRLLSIEWYAVLETITPGDRTVPLLPGTRRAGVEDVAALAAVGQATADEVRRRLDHGDWAYIAVDDGVPVAYIWYRSGRWREDDLEFLLTDGERWGYDAFVLPSHRGRGIAPALAVHALADLKAAGVRRVVSVIDHLNDASRRSAARYGAAPICSFVTIAAPGFGLVHERPAGAGRGSWRAHRGRGPVVRRPPPSPARG